MREGRIGAIVLAGGRSSRFGRDKLAEIVDGQSLLDRAIVAVAAVASDVVVVIAPGPDRSVPAGARLVHDTNAFEGPLAGLAMGLAALKPDVDRAIVVGGDMPSLIPAVLARLFAALGATIDAALLEVDGRPVPLPMALQRHVASPIARSLLDAGEHRLRALPLALRVTIIAEGTWRLDDPNGLTLRDVDVPGDL